MYGSKIPLIHLNGDKEGSLGTSCEEVSNALQTSGFLLVKSDFLPLELQKNALIASEELINDSPETITHPVDPKKYIMIESIEKLTKPEPSTKGDEHINILTRYWQACEQVKRQILNCISIGMGLPRSFFMDLHQDNNSCLRLLHYPGHNDQNIQKIRCKPHSDYGTITLLLTDGVGGLQALVDEKWINIPFVEGALVVNIGSLFSDWTNGRLLATLHRVVSLTESCCEPRTSIAFFADPDENIDAVTNENKMTVDEYIKWRSGGTDQKRSGVAFTTDEEARAKEGGTL
jgi:hypothetical protein